MDRRTFLKTSSAAAAGAATASTAGASDAQPTPPEGQPAILSEHIELVAAVARDAATPAERYETDALLSRIKAATGGRIKIVAREFENPFQAVRDGDTAIAVVRDGAEAAIHPELALFGGLPGRRALSPDLLFAWLNAGGGGLFQEAALGEIGLVAFPASHTGASIGLWSRQPLETLADLQAMDLRVGLGPEVAAALGRSVAPGGGATAAVEVAADVSHAAPAMREAGYATWSPAGLYPQGCATMLYLSQAAWYRLGVAEQTAIEAVAHAGYARALAQSAVARREVAPALFAGWGLERRPLGDAIVQAFEHAGAAVIEQMVASSGGAQEAFASYDRFCDLMTGAPYRAGTYPTAGAGV